MLEQQELEKAQKFLTENKIKRIEADLPDMFEIESSIDENIKYLVLLPDFCSCTHFIFNCIKEKGKVCKHILAAKIAGKVPSTQNREWTKLFEIYD
jgi:predicted nucleic acid-binding Zn finger protein